MDGRAALQDYLIATMVQLCPGAEAERKFSTARRGDEDQLFGIIVPYAKIAGAFGPGETGDPREVSGAPESLRISKEHRYRLSNWPAFDFVILESSDGFAWG